MIPFLSASRRRFLAGLTLGTTGLLPRGAQARAAEAGSDETVCVLTPHAVEGPFYVDPKLVRADITEGRAGIPLQLRLRVVEAGPCTPIPGARVDIWHCDARGLYSGYPGQGDERSVDTSGQTFLRGTQTTDAAGQVAFRTIYPGWYPGRATHIHVKTILDGRSVLTGQIYFPDALNEFLYTNVPAYAGRPIERFVVNANDGIANEQDPQRHAFCALKEERDFYLATLTLGVDRNAAAGGEARRITPRGRLERPPPGPPPGGFAGPPPGPGPRGLKDRLAALVPGLAPRRPE